jgi:hypothetical protein
MLTQRARGSTRSRAVGGKHARCGPRNRTTHRRQIIPLVHTVATQNPVLAYEGNVIVLMYSGLAARWLTSGGVALWQVNERERDIILALWRDDTFCERLADADWLQNGTSTRLFSAAWNCAEDVLGVPWNWTRLRYV